MYTATMTPTARHRPKPAGNPLRRELRRPHLVVRRAVAGSGGTGPVDPNKGNIAGQDIGRTPSFGVFSLHGGWKSKKGVQMTAGVDNLFDRTYDTWAAAAQWWAATRKPPASTSRAAQAFAGITPLSCMLKRTALPRGGTRWNDLVTKVHICFY